MTIYPARILVAIVKAVPAVLPYLSDETKAALRIGVSPSDLVEHAEGIIDRIKAIASGYPGVRSDYWHAVYDAVYDYLTGNKPVTSFVNSVKRAFTEAQATTIEIGYTEAGGELPLDPETSAWLVQEQQAEFGHIEELFARLKEEWEGLDPGAEASARAEGYVGTLDQILSESKLHGAKNKMLTFTGSDGKESCKDCKRMKGQRHRASWWISHDMIPGSSAYECGGWNCEHFLEDDNGNQFTI